MKFTILKKVTGSGAPAPKSKFAFLARLREIEFFPPTDSLGVVLLGDIKLKENCGMMQLYITPSSQEYGYEVSGDSDSKGHKVKFNGTHPGTEQQALEFVTNYLEEEFVILIPDCDKGIRVLGSPDAPLIFTSSHKSSKDSQKFNFIFEQEVATDFIYRLYDGIITLNENIDIDMSDFLEALKNYIKIDGSNLSDAQKQNLRQILGLDNNAGNIGNQDLQLNENRSFNLKSFFLNFFSNSGTAKVGINKNNPETALDVVGGITTDDLKLKKNGNLVSVAIVDAGENPETYSKSQILEVIDSDFVGVVYPTDPTPTIEGSYEPALSSEDGKDINPDDYGTIYPNIQNFKSKAGYRTRFVLKNGVWSKSEVEMPTVQLSTVLNPLSEDKAETGKSVADYIGYFSQTQEEGEIMVDFTNATWINGSYMHPSGNLMPNADTRYLKIPVKAGGSIAYKIAIINGVPTSVFVSASGVIAGFNENSNGVYNFAEIFKEDGFLYLNQNTYATTVNFIHLYNIAEAQKTTLVDYIENKFKVVNPNNKEIMPLEISKIGAYYDLLYAVVGESTVNEPYTVYGGSATSRFYRVFAGDKIYYTGTLGASGIALFNFDGVLSHKLLGGTGSPTIYTEMEIIIPEDGYINLGYVVSENHVLKKASAEQDVTIQQLYDGVGNQQVNLTTKKYISLNKPNNVWVLNLTGKLPDLPGQKNMLECAFNDGGMDFLKCKVEVSLQGQSSLDYPKKNFTFDFINSNGDALVLKIGNLIASDSWHLKGFQKDVSMTRDNLTSTFWHTIRKSAPFPSCLIANIPNNVSSTASDLMYFEEDARFYADGFPVEIYINGQFQGLYIFRLKKSRQNYKLDNKLKTNIMLEFDYMLDASNGIRLLDWKTFDYKQFELKSPKLTGYVAGGVISDADVMASINNFWSWTSAIYNNTATNENNIDLMAWIDYLIACEVADHWDGFSNNILIISHDGIKFSPYIYDTDHTWGMWNGSQGLNTTKTNFILGNSTPRISPQEDFTFWIRFRTKYQTQIKARYTELRKSGIISVQNIQQIATNFIKPYGTEHYKKEFAKWGYGYVPAIGKGNLRQILEMANSSINFLDTQWLNP